MDFRQGAAMEMEDISSLSSFRGDYAKKKRLAHFAAISPLWRRNMVQPLILTAFFTARTSGSKIKYVAFVFSAAHTEKETAEDNLKPISPPHGGAVVAELTFKGTEG